MRAPTHRRFGLLGLGLIALVNAIALGGAAWNRSAVDSRLALGERELHAPYAYGLEREDSGVSLVIDWQVAPSADGIEDIGAAPGWLPYDYARTPAWLDASRLQALGFDVIPPATDAGRAPRQRDRTAWLALELDGPAYQQHVARAVAHLRKATAKLAATGDQGDRQLLEAARERLQRARTGDSRLFVIDAGADGQALRARYPDRRRYAIVEGIVSLAWTRADEHAAWRAQGGIDRLRVAQVHVPRAQVAALGAAARPRTGYEDPPAPPFSATLVHGRRGEPWIEAVGRR